MPESVFLHFSAPDRENLEILRIHEAVASDGPWSVVEDVLEIGEYPDYISQYTTDLATSKLNWFAIQWIDDKGAETEISNAIQGGTDTLVGEIISLVGERDHTLDEQVVRQETEFAIEMYFGIDPYLAETDQYRIKIGLARLVQARVMMSNLAAGGTTSGWTAGLVALKSGTTSNDKLVEWLLKMSADMLGLNYSRIAQMAELPIAGGLSRIVTADISRLLIEVE